LRVCRRVDHDRGRLNGKIARTASSAWQSLLPPDTTDRGRNPRIRRLRNRAGGSRPQRRGAGIPAIVTGTAVHLDCTWTDCCT
jgi:hypothetical protein